MRLSKSLFVMTLSVVMAGCSSLPMLSKESDEDRNASKPNVDEKITSNSSKPKADSGSPKVRKVAKLQNTSKSHKKKRVLPEVVDIAMGKLVFIRSSVVASAVDANIYDVTNGFPRLISDIKNNTQLHYDLAPGRYVFMLRSQSSVDYLEVHVVSHRTYYGVVKPSMGAWKPNFSLQPIKFRSKDEQAANDDVYFFDDEQVETLLSAMTPIVEVRYSPSFENDKKQDTDILELHKEHWQAWSTQSALEKQDDILRVSDGR